ncbi:uncharacterized protein Dvar_13520 [Desulfosarcina variabilis str. Montpellier]
MIFLIINSRCRIRITASCPCLLVSFTPDPIISPLSLPHAPPLIFQIGKPIRNLENESHSILLSFFMIF